MSSNLDGFVKTSKPPSKSLATSQEIRDRGSTFVATVYAASSPEEARRAVNHLKHVTHGARPASHEIAAWRCMVLQVGKSGLGGPDDFEVVSGSDDDGEKYAGGRVLKVMQAEGVLDAVVIVSRWFGGEMLGRVRFDHIEMCAREVCRTFRRKDDMATCITTLTSLDETLASLRSQLAATTAVSSTTETADNEQEDSNLVVSRRPATPSYTALEESLDIPRAKRLITARENSIKSVRAALKKIQEKSA